MQPTTQSRILILATTLLAVIATFQIHAQSLTVLHTFNNTSDGGQPHYGLTLSGTTFYGSTLIGGATNSGTLFSMHIDGSAFTVLHTFSPGEGTYSNYNADGIQPTGILLLTNNILYGCTSSGGANSNGTVFAVHIDGSGFTNLYTFPGNNTNSGGPGGSVVIAGNTLYGTEYVGNSLFSINTNGSNFTPLHGFSGPGYPDTGMILAGNTLFGTTISGGTNSAGSVFAIRTDGSGFTNLYSFTGGIDGASPKGDLLLLGNTLYGTTSRIGAIGAGTIFALGTNGSGFTILHNFGANEGSDSVAPLIASGGTLYGVTRDGGSHSFGTIFAVSTNGTGFTNLYNFTGLSDGANPCAGLTLLNNALYGSAQNGAAGFGTLFRFNLSDAPRLTITQAGTNVILTWSTNTSGYTLQSNTNLSGSSWLDVSPAPLVVNGLNTVTNPSVSNHFNYYRLKQ